MKLQPSHPQFNIALDLEVGDRVRFPDLPGGKTRPGVVVAVVREEDDPYKVIPPGCKAPRYGYGDPRETRSYLVRLDRGNVAYWPRTSMLTPEVPA